MSTKKKTFLLSQELLDEARRVADARTETEAITRALEDLVRRHRFVQSLEEMARLGPFDVERI